MCIYIYIYNNNNNDNNNNIILKIIIVIINNNNNIYIYIYVLSAILGQHEVDVAAGRGLRLRTNGVRQSNRGVCKSKENNSTRNITKQTQPYLMIHIEKYIYIYIHTYIYIYI